MEFNINYLILFTSRYIKVSQRQFEGIYKGLNITRQIYIKYIAFSN